MRKTSLPDPKAVERLRQLIYSTASFQPHLRQDEPDWQAWVSGCVADPHAAQELVADLQRLWLLPFVDVRAGADLLLFRAVELRARRGAFTRTKDCDGLRLCALFELLVQMTLQGFSIIPQNPLHLAQQVAQALRFSRKQRGHLRPLLDLLTDEKTFQPCTGLNMAEAADIEAIIESEHERREGIMERTWKADFKYHDFAATVRRHPEFLRDWQRLKGAFVIERFTDTDGVIRRSGLEEGGWRRPVFSDLSRVEQSFRVAFDFFCWKWFLYGMRKDEPLVQKLACTLTPFGTQIFIPGYWSFDPKRDLNWPRILRLHRARGVVKQGIKLNSGRLQRQEQLRRLALAAAEAKRRGLRGEARYTLLKQAAGLTERTDDAQVRRMLREARTLALP